MTMSRVSWRTVVYFTIVAVRYRALLETRENIPETNSEGKAQVTRIMPEHIVVSVKCFTLLDVTFTRVYSIPDE